MRCTCDFLFGWALTCRHPKLLDLSYNILGLLHVLAVELVKLDTGWVFLWNKPLHPGTLDKQVVVIGTCNVLVVFRLLRISCISGEGGALC